MVDGGNKDDKPKVGDPEDNRNESVDSTDVRSNTNSIAKSSEKPVPRSAAGGAGGVEPPGPAGKGKGNGNGKSKEEERRRRIILALWLLMFTILSGIFVLVFLNLFGGLRKEVGGKKCLDCHYKEMSRQLAAQYKHEPFERERCTECHKNKICNKEKKDFAVVKGSLGSVCFACHSKAKGEEGRKQIHKPFKGKRCTDCHDPHGSQFERLVILPPPELCVSCHYGKSFTQVFQHQPAQMRNCIDCHEPHSSDYAKHLMSGIGDLCYTCHLRVAQQIYRPVKHQPFAAEDCISCHKPHSATEKRLLTTSYNALCEGCHPVVKADFNRISHHPLGVAPMENCGTCHLYHSADYSRLLPVAGTVNCYAARCHPGLQEVFDASEHNSSVMSMLAQKDFSVTCSACHSPHGSDFNRLLTQSRYTICQVCHSFPGRVGEHPVFTHKYSPPTFDRWHNDYMWCGSCHAFHGSPYPTMRLAKGDDLCIKCHDAAQLENVDR